MILNHQQLLEVRAQGIIDCPIGAVGPTSIDVTLAPGFYTERRPTLMDRLLNRREVCRPAMGEGVPPMDFHGLSVMVPPRAFVLASINETLELPPYLTVEVRLRSTPARAALQHALAVWCDPGYEGRLTLELTNSWRWTSMLLKEGDRVAQLIFHKHEPTDKPYRGVYRGDMKTRKAVPHV